MGWYNDDGTLFYGGRKKELIKYKNCHIFPQEIEAAAMKHPEVDDIGVFGVPDIAVQELVSAVVVKAPGSKLTEEEIRDYVNETLDDFKRIRGEIKFVLSIPRNPQGKILRSQLPKTHNTDTNKKSP